MGSPFYIQWHITNFCNLRCRHCYQDDFTRNKDLEWADLKKIADNLLATLREWKRTACINLTGGEPLLKPELFPLLGYLDREPGVGELGLITNGLCFNREVMKELGGFSKLKKLKISLDGADAQINDAIRQKGVFRRVMETLPLIQEQERFEIIFMFTVMKKNFKNLSSLIRLCQDLGVDGLILERFIPWGRGREIIADVLDREEWHEFLTMLLRHFSMDEEALSSLPYQAFQISFRGSDMELSGAPCIIGVDGLCILPEGNVQPCRRFPISVGNLLADSLEAVWIKSELLEVLRNKGTLRGRCGTCEIKECRGCRSLALSLTGDYLGEDPHCWFNPQ